VPGDRRGAAGADRRRRLRTRTPSAIALRGYIRNPAMTGRITELEVLWHPRLKPGYGWIFPCPDGVFNIGVGVAHSRAKGDRIRATMEGVNLRDSLKAFTEVYAPARELVAGGSWVAEPKGAPLRCSLDGARHSRPACWSPAKRPAAPTRSPARASARRSRPASWRRSDRRRADVGARRLDGAKRYEARVAR
jgi:hypothetical protein